MSVFVVFVLSFICSVALFNQAKIWLRFLAAAAMLADGGGSNAAHFGRAKTPFGRTRRSKPGTGGGSCTGIHLANRIFLGSVFSI